MEEVEDILKAPATLSHTHTKSCEYLFSSTSSSSACVRFLFCGVEKKKLLNKSTKRAGVAFPPPQLLPGSLHSGVNSLLAVVVVVMMRNARRGLRQEGP